MPDAGGAPTLDMLARGQSASSLDPPPEPSRVIILTSGTTGTPKGAQRKQPDSLVPIASLLSAIPLRARETTMIAAPMFHSWGMAHFLLSLTLGSTLVVRRRFDPEDTLAAVAHHRASALAVVPVMLQRIMELPDEVVARYDTSALRVIAVSGSALPGDLATRVMDRFGDVVYNLYGSTEVAWATIAGPADLRAAPGTARAARRAGRSCGCTTTAGTALTGPGQTGRIFVGNEMAFDGYTGGGGKDVIDGLMSTGDVGHFDDGGRLFIDGRDDEMIVSGGENVFPREVEDLLADHPCVAEAAVIGVPDDAWGERLRAYVVAVDGMEPTRGRPEGLREGEPRRLQGPARGRVPRRAAAQRDRQGAQARCSSATDVAHGPPLDRAADRLGLGAARPGRPASTSSSAPRSQSASCARVLPVAVGRAAVGEPALGVEHEDVGRRLRAVGRARRPASRRAGRASASRRARPRRGATIASNESCG